MPSREVQPTVARAGAELGLGGGRLREAPTSGGGCGQQKPNIGNRSKTYLGLGLGWG